MRAPRGIIIVVAAVAALAACGGGYPQPAPTAGPTWSAEADPVELLTSEPAATARPRATAKPRKTAAPAVYYANCTAARAAGAAPIHRGQPGYRSALDRDHDGIACE